MAPFFCPKNRSLSFLPHHPDTPSAYLLNAYAELLAEKLLAIHQRLRIVELMTAVVPADLLRALGSFHVFLSGILRDEAVVLGKFETRGTR